MRAAGCARAGGAAGGPRPEKVVAPDRTEGVQHLAADEQAGMAPALHRPRVDLRQADAAAGHLGLAVSLVAGPRQLPLHQRLDQALPLRPAELRQRPRAAARRPRRPARRPAAIGQLARGARRRRSEYPRAERRLPRRRVERRPADPEARGAVALGARADRDVRHVEHRRAAVAVMGEQEAAARGRALRRPSRAVIVTGRRDAASAPNGGLRHVSGVSAA